MNPLARHKSPKNADAPCPDLVHMAERELSAFFHAVARSFGSEQAKLSAEDWLQELIRIGTLPASAREWRLITAKVSARLASRVKVAARLSEQVA
jgi:hypothetical protein